jgi:hypothetical protein
MCLSSSYLDYCGAQITELAKTFPQADGFWPDIIFMNECCCSNCRRSMEAKDLDWQDPSHRRKEAYARRERYFEARERRGARRRQRPSGLPQLGSSPARRPAGFSPLQPSRDRVASDRRVGLRPFPILFAAIAFTVATHYP